MASGYDLSNQIPFRLMQGRLGVYEKPSSENAHCVEGINQLESRL